MQHVTPYLHYAQYHETDQMGVIHHANYIKWFEEARTDFLEKIGIGYKDMEASGLMSPVIGIQCAYRSSVRYGDTVAVEAKIIRYNGAKMTVSYRITDAASGDVRATGMSEHCFLNRDFRPIRLKLHFPRIDQTIGEMVQEDTNLLK